MSCQVDSYYTTDNILGSCGYCGTSYDDCGTELYPGCCPDGTHSLQNDTGCGSCTYRRADSKQFKCAPDEPAMNQTSQLNCCSNQNLPSNSPNGYCATGWCPGSASCTSFMTTYCAGNNLQTDQCQQFCKANPGKCDQALQSYCLIPANFTQGVCGCALPANQYLLSSLKTPDGEAIPISCDQRCGVNDQAIRLQGQPDCEIGSICVADLTDVTINLLQSQIQSGITINQNCGAQPALTPPAPPPSTFIQNFVGTTRGKIILAIFVIVIIAIIILAIWLATKEGTSATD